MTQRPQDLIGIPTVGALDLVRRQPDTAESVGRTFWWNVQDTGSTDGLTVGLPAPPCDPGSSQTTEHRIERRGEATIGALTYQAALESPVFVGLPIRHDDQLRLERNRILDRSLRKGPSPRFADIRCHR